MSHPNQVGNRKSNDLYSGKGKLPRRWYYCTLKYIVTDETGSEINKIRNFDRANFSYVLRNINELALSIIAWTSKSLRSGPNDTAYAHAVTLGKPALQTWHARLGHASMDSVRKLAASGAVVGLDLEKPVQPKDFCSSCMRGKQSKSVLRTNRSRSKERGAVIHSGVCGPMSCPSFSGCKYFVSFIDEFSGFMTIIPIKAKSEVKKEFQHFQAWVERRFNCILKRLHSDNGGEYVALKDYLITQGIEQTKSPSHSPNMNAIAERANRTIVESARSMLEHANLPRSFWAEAVVHAARIRNMFFCPRNDSITPYEVMHGTKPVLSYLRVFGCLAWNHVPKDKRKKLDAKSELGIVIGCFENSQYKLWIPSRECAVLSRDASISEHVFPGEDISELSTGDSLVSRNEVSHNDMTKQTTARVPPRQQESPVLRERTPGPQQPITSNDDRSNHERERHDLTSEEQDMLTHYPESNDPPVDESDEEEEGFGRNSDTGAARRYPRRHRTQTEFYVPESAHLAAAHSNDTEPNTVTEALSSVEAEAWRKVINSELQSLDKHKVWYCTNLPAGKKTLPTRFVFQKKLDSHGKLVRHKARLVVRGYLQGSVEYTYAPVVDFSAVRICLALAVQRGYFIHQMDVRTAFLHGNIDDEIYVTQPNGLEVGGSNTVMRLRKGLYGLKQSPRLWSQKWRQIMKLLKFSMLLADSCVFFRGKLWLLLCVDDIVIMSPEMLSIQQVKYDLSLHLDVKDMGTLSSFLGISFKIGNCGAWMSQSGYVEQILKRFGMDKCKPVFTPMIENGTSPLHQESVKEVVSPLKYQEVVGCLLFLATRTRTDISFAVGILCRHASAPTAEHWVQMKRILRYLKGTVQHSLWFDKAKGDLVAYCDADWAGNRADRKSTSGLLIQLGRSTVSWKTLKQNCVALSTTEAEYISMSEATKEIVWLRKLLEELDGKRLRETALHVDNQGALVWGSEGVRHAKHVAIRANFVKQEVESKAIRLVYCPSYRMPADILTKSLPRIKFERHRENLSVFNMDTARGGVGCSPVTIEELDIIE